MVVFWLPPCREPSPKGALLATCFARSIRMNAEHETPEWLKFVDHTADAGIAVEAPDLVQLFERAAWGMFSVITDVAAARSTETSRISIDALDRAALLVRWLSELNYRHVTEQRIFAKFEVVTLSEQHLESRRLRRNLRPGAPHDIHRDQGGGLSRSADRTR